MLIEEAMVSELNAITSLGSRVYPIFAQQNSVIPYLTYENTTTEQTKTHTTYTGLTSRDFRIDVFEDKYSEIAVLSKLVIDEIKTWEKTNLATTGPYIQDLLITDEFKTYDNETLRYQFSVEITITYQEV